MEKQDGSKKEKLISFYAFHPTHLPVFPRDALDRLFLLNDCASVASMHNWHSDTKLPFTNSATSKPIR